SLLLVPSLTTMAAAQTTDVNTQLKNVADKIRAKTVAWKMPEAELAPELEELDAIYLQHRGENPEDLANVLRLKATVYWSVVDNSEKGIAVIRQIKKDYTNTTVGRDADRSSIMGTISKTNGQSVTFSYVGTPSGPTQYKRASGIRGWEKTGFSNVS